MATDTENTAHPLGEPTEEQIARLIAASPDIRPLCIEQAAERVDTIAAMARSWIMNGDEQHGVPLQNLCIAFGFQRTEIERLRVENANLRARRNDVRDWAMVNEIAEPPLDWAGLGRVLNYPDKAESGLESPAGLRAMEAVRKVLAHLVESAPMRPGERDQLRSTLSSIEPTA